MAKKDKSEDAPVEPEEVKGAPELKEEPEEPQEAKKFDPLDETIPEEPAEEPEPKPEEDEKPPLLEAKSRDRSGDNVFKRFGHWYKTHKKLSIPLTVLVILAVILAVPATRYQALGLFIKKNFSVTVLDTESSKPISGALVEMAGKSAETDVEGKATITELKPGPSELKVTKKYYEDSKADVTVSLSDGENNKEMKLKATGRQVAVVVKHKITGKVLSGATLKALDTEAETDAKGEAVIVLPADQQKVNVTITKNGFNDGKANLVITEEANKNNFTLTPSGKVYFLSKASGKIDVVKSNLDGTERKVVVAGTGNELDNETTLLASRDWKYLMLKAKRQGELAKLHLIDTSNDQMTVMDEGNADFTLVGWSGQNFVYVVNRRGIPDAQPKRAAVKSFDASSKKLRIIDETAADLKKWQSGRIYTWAEQTIGWTVLVGDKVMYSKGWVARYRDGATTQFQIMSGKKFQVVEADPSSGNKRAVLDLALTTISRYASTYLNPLNSYSPALYEPKELYFYVNGDQWPQPKYYEYENGSVKESAAVKTFYDQGKVYPTFLLSPSGEETFWTESRDGKQTLFIGNAEGENERQVAAASEYTQFGWYTDDYLLVSKDQSELYIVSREKGAKAVKVTNYHKPTNRFYGYGGGYGGY